MPLRELITKTNPQSGVPLPQGEILQANSSKGREHTKYWGEDVHDGVASSRSRLVPLARLWRVTTQEQAISEYVHTKSEVSKQVPTPRHKRNTTSLPA